MDKEVEQLVTEWVKVGRAVKMKYVGVPTLTRGDYGENVEYGYAVGDYIYVWDSTFGWFLWDTVDGSLQFKKEEQVLAEKT